MRKFSKFFTTSLLVTLALPFLLFPLANLEAATTGLLAAYSFDAGSGSTAVDASGNNYTATITGASWTTAGKYGSALSFDGINDAVAGPSIALPAAFTFMAWINNPTDEAYETIVTIGEFRDLYLGSGFITFYDGADEYVFGGKITNNAWHHVALTYDGTNLNAYLNGVQRGSPQPSTFYSNTAPIQVGAWVNVVSNDDFFKGLIDEVRVYNRVLSRSEIQSDMNTAINPPVTPPPPGPDTTSPEVSITSLVNGPSISRATPFTIQASASDNVGVSKVDFFINGTLKCSDTSPAQTSNGSLGGQAAPYTCSWKVPGRIGRTYHFQAQATDSSGNVGTSSIVTVTAK